MGTQHQREGNGVKRWIKIWHVEATIDRSGCNGYEFMEMAYWNDWSPTRIQQSGRKKKKIMMMMNCNEPCGWDQSARVHPPSCSCRKGHKHWWGWQRWTYIHIGHGTPGSSHQSSAWPCCSHSWMDDSAHRGSIKKGSSVICDCDCILAEEKVQVGISRVDEWVRLQTFDSDMPGMVVWMLLLTHDTRNAIQL